MPLPSSLPWMESVDAKFARALEHFQTYNNDASNFAQTVEHNLVIKHNPATGAKWLVFWDSDQIPPIRLSAIVGDVFFNLRSALDNLVCGLARKAETSADCETLQFPICTTEEAFDVALKKKRLLGVSDEGVRLMRSVQPFHAPENSRMLHPLWLLHELNNQDKHRVVHITIGASQLAEVALLNDDGALLLTVKLPPTTGFGPVTVDLPASLPAAVRVQMQGRFVIAFRRHALLQDRAVADVLAACIRFVELHVINLLRPLFRETP